MSHSREDLATSRCGRGFHVPLSRSLLQQCMVTCPIQCTAMSCTLPSAMLYACRPTEAMEGGERPSGALSMNGHAPSDTAATLPGIAGSTKAVIDQPKQSAADNPPAVQTDAAAAGAIQAGTPVKSAAKTPEDASKPRDRNGKEHRRSKEREKGDRKGSREREGKRGREKDSKSGRSREKERDRKADERKVDGKSDGKRGDSREKERKGDNKSEKDRKPDKDRRRSRSRSVKRRRSRSVSPAARRPTIGVGGPFGIDRRVPPGANSSLDAPCLAPACLRYAHVAQDFCSFSSCIGIIAV